MLWGPGFGDMFQISQIDADFYSRPQIIAQKFTDYYVLLLYKFAPKFTDILR